MMNLIKWDPFGDLDEMRREMLGNFSTHDFTLPTMDIYDEEGKGMVIETHVPNFTKDDIDIAVNEGLLEVRAEKKIKDEKKDRRKYMLKESATSFYRRVRLPKNIDESKIDASFDKGMLVISIPYRQLPKPKKVQIKEKN